MMKHYRTFNFAAAASIIAFSAFIWAVSGDNPAENSSLKPIVRAAPAAVSQPAQPAADAPSAEGLSGETFLTAVNVQPSQTNPLSAASSSYEADWQSYDDYTWTGAGDSVTVSLSAGSSGPSAPSGNSSGSGTASGGGSSSASGSGTAGGGASGGGSSSDTSGTGGSSGGGGAGGPVASETNSLECEAFAVEFTDGAFKIFKKPSQDIATLWQIDDSLLGATVRKSGDELWELEIRAKKTVRKVWFPWFEQPLVSSQKASDYVLYYPLLLGTVTRSDFNKPFEWWGVDYPGAAFAPLMVLTDNQEAIMAAAANWPPKKTSVYYSFLRMALVCEEKIEPSQTATFKTILCRAQSDASNGIHAWHSVVDVYKSWLRAQMETAELMPINYPSWMKEIDGFINVQLQNSVQFNITEISNTWNKWRNTFPWLQFWGQMSDYAGKEGGGCCLEKQDMHIRYKPEIVQFARTITGQNAHVGYYAKPRGADPIVNNPAAFEFLFDWIQKNENEYYANAFYIDVLGNMYFGEPLGVAALFRDVFPQDMFIEYPVDIYPTAFLVSGSLGGDYCGRGVWAQSPEEISSAQKTAAFPAFGRYLLDDRILFMGESNGDHLLWGPKAQYWTQRKAFLLGAKYDVTSFTLRSADEIQAMELAIAERKRVGWWQRQPVYLDTKGISNVSTGIQVTRFMDRDNKNLFVIDNWNLASGKRFTFGNQAVTVPMKKLSILELN
ncbi:MAG: hypothetical protein L0Y36_07010 [Planctomycetales bacterium]|nr:hypothetical protein [Planctomycetales bacterium]